MTGGEESAHGGESISPSFRLTSAFLDRHPRYRHTLSLTPEHFRFDPVLWNSSLAVLRGLLRSAAEEAGLVVTEEDVEAALRNLIEGIVRRSADWEPASPGDEGRED